MSFQKMYTLLRVNVNGLQTISHYCKLKLTQYRDHKQFTDFAYYDLYDKNKFQK